MTNQLDKLSGISSVLPTDIITEIRDILIKPMLENPYETLWEQIIAQLTVSKHTQITRLLEQEELEDSTPSQFFKRLQQLAEGTVNKTIVHYIFFTAATRKIQTGTGILRWIYPNRSGGNGGSPHGQTTSHSDAHDI